METIKMYLENMFAALPKTAQMNDLKYNILTNMEEKYHELKADGKSENEAIGIVISEFGNIDELINELGIKREEEVNNKPLISKEETYAYLSMKQTTGKQIAIGVFLCILAPAVLILINALFEDGIIGGQLSQNVGSMIGLIALFVLVAIAVAIFIYTGMNFERYRYIEDSGVTLTFELKTELQQKYNDFNKPFFISIIIGVCMLVLSPISLFITSFFGSNMSTYGVVILLTIVAVAVTLFIYFGSIRDGYGQLLMIGDYARTPAKEKEDRVIGAVASVVWPLATAAFLFLGFTYNLWGKAWIIFPITGILFGMFSAVYSILTSDNHQRY